MEALDEPRSDDPDHAAMPVGPREDVAARAALRLGPLLDLVERLAQNAILDLLPLAVQGLELAGQAFRFGRLVGEKQIERRARVAEASGCVDPGSEAEGDSTGVDSCRIHVRHAHERPQPRLARPRELPQAGDDQPPVLVEERDDVGDRRERDEVEVPLDALGRAERLGELEDDAGPAQLGERIVGWARGDDRAVRQSSAGPVMVGDDDFEARRLRLSDLFHRGDAAVDGEQQSASFSREARQRLARDPVPLFEATRQMPLDLGAEIPQDENGESRRTDPVDVVVAVDADPAPPSMAARMAAQAPRMSPSRNGSCSGLAAERNASAASGSPYPRRTRTPAVVSETPRAFASATTSRRGHGRSVHVPSYIVLQR